MGVIASKPEWVDSDENGEFKCDHCSYKNSEEFLQIHIQEYHTNHNMVLYMDCNGSIEGRDVLNDCIDAEWIDCTGGQAAYKDSDLQKFGEQLVRAARDNNIKLFNVLRIQDPGLGLDFPSWWVEAGIEAGVFERYDIPDDVKWTENDGEWGEDDEKDDEEDDEEDDEKSESDKDDTGEK
jgi:hypothetical protein